MLLNILIKFIFILCLIWIIYYTIRLNRTLKLSNKINKYDVGGTEFVYPDSLENYKVNVEDTLYKYVEDNSNNSRRQSLPEVSEVQITDFKKVKYKVSNTELDAYEVALKWSYAVDMGYESEGSVIILEKDNKYYVVEKK